MTKERADQLLVTRGLCPTRSQAQALIMAGRVLSAGKRVEKSGDRLPGDAPLEVIAGPRYVSRGGEKLHHALEVFALDVTGKRCVDIGASSGGFTDCLLQHGASIVHAVDVGYGQLDSRLRDDPRVRVRERQNARHLTAADFDAPIDLVVVDASFISLDKLLGAIAVILPAQGELVALIKPQFEAGRQAAARGRGVIRDEAVRRQAIDKAMTDIQRAGFVIVAETPSPLPGPKGNLEHLVLARRS